MTTTPKPIPPAAVPVVPAASASVRIRPAWWVPLHAFAILAARLVYPLALVAAATWLVSIIIQTGASAWFILAVLIVVGLLIFAAPRDPEA